MKRLLAIAALLVPMLAPAADGTRWIDTWIASPQPTWGPDFALPTGIPATLADVTLRQVVRTSLGGRRVRVELSNEYGSTPLAIGAVHVALAAEGGRIVPGSDRAVTFGGRACASVPPGAPLLSDPVDLAVGPLAQVAVSIWLPQETRPATFHWDGRATAFLGPGNQVGARALQADARTTARIFLGALQVEAAGAPDVVVAFGDSITDGNGAGIDRDARWPDFLAARLAPHDVAVLNAGISGARLLGDGMGANALARFDRDVLARPGVRSVVVLMGINDIAWPGTAFDRAGERPAADALVAAYRQLIARAHARGVRILAGTLTPFEGALEGTPLADYHAPAKDELRAQVDDWIRRSGEFDGVIDFDALLRDPAHPGRLAPAFDSGDHLHPGDRGNEAMARSIPVPVLLPERRGISRSPLEPGHGR